MRSFVGYFRKIRGSAVEPCRFTLCFSLNGKMSDVKNRSLKLKRPPTDELPLTKNTAKSDFSNHFSHYITSDTNSIVIPDSIRSYFVLYVKQLQSVDGMLDVTRHQLELFVNANILHKFNTVVETIRNSLKTFTNELVDQIGQNKKDDPLIISDNLSNSASKPKKVKLSQKSSDKPVKNTTSNDEDSDDDLFGADFETQMGEVAEKCEKQYSRSNAESDNFGSTSSNQRADKNSFENDRDGYVRVFVDGCCLNNGKANAKAGYGVWFGDDSPHNLSEAVHGVATNNNAEIQAATAAFRIAKNQNLERLRIYSDSEFFINCMSSWIHNWRTNGWKTRKNQPVRNKESLVECEEALRSWGGRVDYAHVAGHTGIHGNEQADRLAKEGAVKYK